MEQKKGKKKWRIALPVGAALIAALAGLGVIPQKLARAVLLGVEQVAAHLEGEEPPVLVREEPSS